MVKNLQSPYLYNGKSGLLRKEGFQLETLFNVLAAEVVNHHGQVYEEPAEIQTQVTERYGKLHNQHLKASWQNHCDKIDEIRVLCDGNYWKNVTKKLHLSYVLV